MTISQRTMMTPKTQLQHPTITYSDSTILEELYNYLLGLLVEITNTYMGTRNSEEYKPFCKYIFSCFQREHNALIHNPDDLPFYESEIAPDRLVRLARSNEKKNPKIFALQTLKGIAAEAVNEAQESAKQCCLKKEKKKFRRLAEGFKVLVVKAGCKEKLFEKVPWSIGT